MFICMHSDEPYSLDMPFQLVPVLEVDGSAKLCGHVNIARYIGEKYSEYFLMCNSLYLHDRNSSMPTMVSIS